MPQHNNKTLETIYSDNQILRNDSGTIETQVNVEYKYTKTDGKINVLESTIKVNTAINDWLSPLDKYNENKDFSLTINPKSSVRGNYIIFESVGTFISGSIKVGSVGFDYNPVVYKFTGVINVVNQNSSFANVNGYKGRLW